MASARRPRSQPLQPKTNIEDIVTEAQNRWLKPVEVCEVLNNYQIHGFKLNPIAPVKPASGSLFLFDRNVLRYFRKDGHNWRKKKDGRTVREAHERLKIGNVDVLHCYYAHGETNLNFQRRCYWLLDPSMDHIVLVHYREVDELGRIVISDMHSTPPSHVPSPPEGSRSSSMSIAHEHEGGDAGEFEEVSNVSPAEACRSVLNSCITQLEQDPPLQQKPGILEVRPGWTVLDSLSMSRNSETLRPALAGIERMLDSPGVFPLGVSQSSLLLPSPLGPEHLNREQQQSEYSLPMQGSSEESVNSSAESRTKSNGVGLQPFTKEEELDIVEWKELLGNTQSNQKVSSNQTGGVGGSATSDEVVRSMDGLNWTDMLEQCTTPETHQALLDLDQSENEPVVQLVNDFSQQEGLSYLTQVLSPTVPTPNVQCQDPLRKENAPKAHQKQFPLTRVDLQNTKARWDGEILDLEHSTLVNIQNSEVQSLKEAAGNKNMEVESLTKNLELDSFMKESSVDDLELDKFKKLNSFGRWMSTQLSDNSESLLMDSGWPSTPVLEDRGVGEDVNGISVELQAESGVNTSVTLAQRYSIIDFSPGYGYSSEETKVIVTGMFIGDNSSRVSDFRWHCMFGEIEVPAELLGGEALRCNAPAQAAGRVAFYITCGDRQAHSEICEFEYRNATRADSKPVNFEHHSENEMLLKIHLAHMLLEVVDSPKTHNEGDSLKQSSHSDFLNTMCTHDEWLYLELLATTPGDLQTLDFHEQLLQMLLKSHMQRWLQCRIEDEGKGPAVLNEKGQGVLHMAAALGYHWAIAPLMSAGLPINFRDVHGWTALHWAAWYGQEEAIVHLLEAGADPAAVTDPTVTNTAGQSAADLAATNGHVGISGFLAESSLRARLSSMTVSEDPIDIALSCIAGDNAVAKLAHRESLKRSVVRLEDQRSLEASIEALRNAARSKALIQAAFRQHSFQKRENDTLASMQSDEYDLTTIELQAWITANAAKKIQKAYRGHHGKQQLAAIRIQNKFRGWRARRDFLSFRQHIVKLQAHVRGNLVRKRFKKLLWSVSIVEKAILRWLRRRHGLRGFKNEFCLPDNDNDEFLREGRKRTEVALEIAVTRVEGMVPSSTGRAQYLRLREKSLESHQKGKSPEPEAHQLMQSSKPEMQQQTQSCQVSIPDYVQASDDQFMSFRESEHQGQNTQVPPPHVFPDTTDDALMIFTVE
jgi:hypothetical protein